MVSSRQRKSGKRPDFLTLVQEVSGNTRSASSTQTASLSRFDVRWSAPGGRFMTSTFITNIPDRVLKFKLRVLERELSEWAVESFEVELIGGWAKGQSDH